MTHGDVAWKALTAVDGLVNVTAVEGLVTRTDNPAVEPTTAMAVET
jgi:hypothetical protein